jgi:hypothetical protein
MFFFWLEQAWQCSPGKEVQWNLLALFTASGMLYLEISLMAFLLNDNYMNAMETLSHTSIVAGIIVFVDTLLKVSLVLINIYIMRASSVSIWLFCKMLVDYFYD